MTPSIRRRGVVGSLIALVLAGVVAAVVLISSGPAGIRERTVYGSGPAMYQLVVAPSEPGDHYRVTEAQARRALDHPAIRSTYTVTPRLIVFGFGRITAPALLSAVPPDTHANRPAWIGIYEVPSKAVWVNECGLRGPGGPPPREKPPANYYFATIIDPDTGKQAIWNENASLIVAWRCSSRRSW